MEDYEGADWVLIADEVPVDESRRDALIERFQVTQRPATDDLPRTSTRSTTSSRTPKRTSA